MRGASTITQQLAKNLYLSPTRNPFRKLTELLITRRLEHELSKTRIFELYLNNIEWGDGIWGAEAAAQTYFGIPASAIGPDQAAIMAGAIVNPRVLNIAKPERAPSGTSTHHPRAHGKDYAAAGDRQTGSRRNAPSPLLTELRWTSRSPNTNPKKNRRLTHLPTRCRMLGEPTRCTTNPHPTHLAPDAPSAPNTPDAPNAP